MSAKKSTQVIIGGKVYTLSGYEEEDYLQRVATYINEKISEFGELEGYKHLPADMRTMLLELNIADDYFKAKSKVDQLERDIAIKDDELYKLKHELISGKVKSEEIEKKLEELEKENKELLLNKARLEASLEDAMLGSVRK